MVCLSLSGNRSVANENAVSSSAVIPLVFTPGVLLALLRVCVHVIEVRHSVRLLAEIAMALVVGVTVQRAVPGVSIPRHDLVFQRHFQILPSMSLKRSIVTCSRRRVSVSGCAVPSSTLYL